MGPDDKNIVWFPFFVFENTKQKLESLVDRKAHIGVERHGLGVASDKSLIENKLLFEGAENPIIYDRVYSEQFDCEGCIQTLKNWFCFRNPTVDFIKFLQNFCTMMNSI